MKPLSIKKLPITPLLFFALFVLSELPEKGTGKRGFAIEQETVEEAHHFVVLKESLLSSGKGCAQSSIVRAKKDVCSMTNLGFFNGLERDEALRADESVHFNATLFAWALNSSPDEAPYWQSLWGRVLLSLSILGTILAAHVLRTQNIKMDKRRLKIEIAMKTAELQEKKRALQRAYDRMEERVADRTAKLREEIIERVRVERRLRKSRKDLRNLATFLESVREKERTRVAREIHDELGQTLSLFKIQLGALQKRTADPQKHATQIKSLEELIDNAIVTVQKIATDLRPPILDHLGLAAAIEWQAQDFQERSGIQCHIETFGDVSKVSPEVATALFRIFQEAFTNVVRHAEATEVYLSLKNAENTLTMTIEDNGKGVTEEQIHATQSIGLIGIRERVHCLDGNVEFKGAFMQGTTVTIKIPLK